MSSVRARYVFGFAVFLLPPLSLIAPLADAPLLILVSLFSLLPWMWHHRHGALRQLRTDPMLWLTGAFAVWALASLSWSLAPTSGLTLLPRVVLTLVAGIALATWAARTDSAGLPLFRRALVMGMITAALWLVVDMVLLNHALSGWLTGHPDLAENIPKRGLTLLSILVWPTACVLWSRHRWGATALTVLLIALVLAGPAGMAKAAIVLAATTLLLGLMAPKTTALLLVATVTLGVLAAPFVLPRTVDSLNLIERTEGSTRHRLVIWRFVSDHIQQRPLTGWGFDMSRSLPGGTAIDPVAQGQYLPLHPHNAPLQWWLETGLPGALSGIAMIMFLAWRAATRLTTQLGRATGLAALTAGVTVLCGSYGAWQLWWLSALALAVAVVILADRIEADHHGSPKARRAAVGNVSHTSLR